MIQDTGKTETKVQNYLNIVPKLTGLFRVFLYNMKRTQIQKGKEICTPYQGLTNHMTACFPMLQTTPKHKIREIITLVVGPG